MQEYENPFQIWTETSHSPFQDSFSEKSFKVVNGINTLKIKFEISLCFSVLFFFFCSEVPSIFTLLPLGNLYATAMDFHIPSVSWCNTFFMHLSDALLMTLHKTSLAIPLHYVFVLRYVYSVVVFTLCVLAAGRHWSALFCAKKYVLWCKSLHWIFMWWVKRQTSQIWEQHP